MKTSGRVLLRTWVLMVLAVVPLAAQSADQFRGKCSMCHGADGRGETGMGKAYKVPDLGSPEVQNLADADLEAVITNGKGSMPKYQGRLSKEQISDLVKYIRTFKKK